MKESIYPQVCEKIMRIILLGDDADQSEKTVLNEHLKTCAQCRSFAALQGEIRNSLATDIQRERPAAETLTRIQHHMSDKNHGRRDPGIGWLPRLLGYRIPVYQAMVIAMFVGLFFWSYKHLPLTFTRKQMQPVEASVEVRTIDASQAVHLLSAVGEQKLGRSIMEDSLYVRFAFTM